MLRIPTLALWFLASCGTDDTPAPTAALGGHGQPVDGIACGPERIDYHIHAHLTLYVDGQSVPVPAKIGITTTCLYLLHTHDGTGVLHIESPIKRDFTLGQFFDIWGQSLGPKTLLGHDGAVLAFVNGTAVAGDPRDIVFADRDETTLELGLPVVPAATSYRF